MVGRDVEFDILRAILRRARAGHPSIAVVTGEAGVGKTRLVSDFVTAASRSGWQVIQGACAEQGAGALPYAPFTGELMRRFARGDSLPAAQSPWLLVSPDLRSLDGLAKPAFAGDPGGADRRHVLFEGVVDTIAELCGQAPLLIVVEDAQWADRSTIDLLTYVFRRLPDKPLAAILTARTDHSAGPGFDAYLVELARLPAVDRIDLARLNRADVFDLSRAILGREPDGDEFDRVWSLSQGNPFYAEELLANPEHRLPDSLRHLALARIARLGPAARELVQAAAVGGSVVSHGELEAVTGLADTEMSAGIREALQARLLERNDPNDSYSFRHALVGEAIRSDLVAGDRRRLHAAYAAHLDRATASDPKVLALRAGHLDAAGSPAAVGAYVAAGDAATGVGASPEALRHFRRAIELRNHELATRESPTGQPAHEIAMRAAGAAFATGDPAAAVALLAPEVERVHAILEPEALGVALERLATYEHASGLSPGAVAHATEAVALAQALPDGLPKAGLLNSAARILVVNREPAGDEPAREALRIAREIGSTREEGRALATLGNASFARTGDTDRAIELLAAAVANAEDAGDPATVSSAGSSLMGLAIADGRFEDAETAWRSLSEFVGSSPVPLSVPDRAWIAIGGAYLYFETGRWADGEALLAAPELRTASGQQGVMLDFFRARFAAARGLPDEALALAGTAELAVHSMPMRRVDLIAEIDAAAGRWDRVAVADRTWAMMPPLPAAAMPAPSLTMRACAELWAAARTRGDDAAAERHAAEAEEVAGMIDAVAARWPIERTRPRRLECLVALARAELGRVRNSNDPEPWRAALDRTLEMGARYAQVYPRYRLAEALLGQPRADRKEATSELRTARALAAEIGAVPLLTLIDGLAARAHIAPETARPIPQAVAFGDRPTPARPAGGRLEWSRRGLTDREIEVLALLGRGQTNRQIGRSLFITEKTAAVHVSRILDKLGVANRVEAALLASLTGLADDE
jgi:DNA-binding CsgD family transcriptional regulator/tetratricopeptide (TPR) repeat protein